jgi:eukaryotic-like serine/threonine-protein kinase
VETRGRVLGNRYELLVPLASGGMGRVWRARDTLLERPVAVKVLRNEFTGDATFRARFRAEAQHTAGLHDPHIAAVFDYGELEADGECLAYLVMELVEGEALSSLLEREGRLSPARALDVLRQTAAALAAAHAAGVVHRDVKPGNVLVGNDGIVKITDFGIAWSASSVPLTGTGQVVGTAHYLSPEQAEGAKATPASDVYALGMVAYECLAGRRAFDGENSVQIALKQIREQPDPLPDDVPLPIRSVVERALAKDPVDRYPDGAALRDAVEVAATWSPTVPIGGGGATGTWVLELPASWDADPSAGAGRRAGRRVLVGMLAAAAAVAVLVGALADGGETPPAAGSTATPPATSSSAPAAPTTVTVDAADLVGRPLAEVQAELTALGLAVEVADVATADVAPGLVTAVGPEGELTPGDTVTVSVATAPPVAPVAPAPPVVSQTPPTASTPDRAPANTPNGNGNGHGNGHGNGNGKR